MARPKTINDADAINLVNQYFVGPCAGDASRLKLPDIADYIQQNGYPNYRVETLRRSPVVRQYVDSLLSTAKEQARVKLVAYQSLDIEALLDNNRTRTSLVKALTNIDMYYKTIADTAAEIIKKEREREDEIGELKARLDEAAREKEALHQSVNTLKKKVRELTEQNAAFKKVVDKYVYPEMANVLLAESGYIQLDTEYVDSGKVEEDTINPDTRITSGSKVIEGMFKKFED